MRIYIINRMTVISNFKIRTNQMIDISEFIRNNITNRKESLFLPDIEANYQLLFERIKSNDVLVIGGAGSIGSSFIKAILPFKPKKLIVVDTNENGLTELTRDLRSTHGITVPIEYKTYPMSFADRTFHRMFKYNKGFQIVANFAAHKHVRSEKDYFSISSLIQNNVINAVTLLDFLEKSPPNHFFCVSTDKAANPVNIMGASKKVMEEVIMAYSNKFSITTARFANVAFSNGSLLDGFVNRIIKNQPLSAPMDIKRYFVSPEESGHICLLACILGDSGDIFFPKLDTTQMKSLTEIARDFLIYLNMEPHLCSSEEEAKKMAFYRHKDDKNYPVYFVRPDTSGEKNYEEFYTCEDEIILDRYYALGVIINSKRCTIEEIKLIIKLLKSQLEKPFNTKANIVNILESYIPSFKHIETGKYLDQKM